MALVVFLARAVVRRRARGLAALALVIAVGIGVSLAAGEAAARTERAYPAYLRDAEIGDLVVNPSLSTERAEELIASAPGVESYATDDVLTATIDEGAPRTQSKVDSTQLQTRLSSDGRYVRQDRPVIHEGRMVGQGDEVFLNREAAEELDLGVGDEVPIAFWVTSFNTPGLGPAQDDIVRPIGRARGRVVGIGVLSDEVLADELYSRQRMIITPELGEPYTCTYGPITRDTKGDLEALFAQVVPAECSLSYRYFSVQLGRGDDGVPAVVAELEEAFERENAKVPTALRELDVGYIVIPSSTRDERERVDRALEPAVTALRLFAVAAAASTVVVVALGALRIVRQEQTDVRVWRALGVTRNQRFLALGLPLALGGAVGLGGAVLVGWMASGLGPVASARSIRPRPGLGLSGDVTALIIGTTAAGLFFALAIVAVTTARSRTTSRSRRPSVVGRAVRGTSPPFAFGVRAAARGSGAGAVLLGSIAAVTVVVASLVFSTSLAGLIDRPARYGWPYDAAVMIGYGYGGAELEDITESLSRPEVERWGIANLGSVTIEGETIASVADVRGFDSMPMAVIEGRLPKAAGEIALGVQTARDLDLDIGDRRLVSHYFGARRAKVTGTVVMPPVGPYESDRAATGQGMVMSKPFLEAIVADAEKAAGVPAGSLADTGLGAFVAIDLEDGAEPSDFIDRVQPELLSWDRNGFESPTYDEPVRPADVAGVADMRGVPLALGLVFALAMAIALAIGIAVATRERRRELAILGALGCSARERARSVRWHALAVVAVALLVGGPMGMLVGRAAYRAFATDLGVVPDVVVSIPWTVGVVLTTVVIGLLASLGPARRAAREPVALVLRDAAGSSAGLSG